MRIIRIDESRLKKLFTITDNVEDLEDELDNLNKEFKNLISKFSKKTNKKTEKKDEEETPPFLTFYEEVLKFVKGLLNDPINTKPSTKLKSYGITNGELRQKLYDYDVITKKENIDEPFDETSGKKVSRYYVSYKVHKENFKDKIRKMYNDLF